MSLPDAVITATTTSMCSTPSKRWPRRAGSRRPDAFAWMLQAPGVTAPIIGATKIAATYQAFDAIELKLSAEEIASLEEPYRPHPVIGHAQPDPRRMVSLTYPREAGLEQIMADQRLEALGQVALRPDDLAHRRG